MSTLGKHPVSLLCYNDAGVGHEVYRAHSQGQERAGHEVGWWYFRLLGEQGVHSLPYATAAEAEAALNLMPKGTQ